VFAVLGDPIAHSRSPAMHAAAFAALDLPHRYVPLRVAASELATALASVRGLGFGGVNLTVPHKVAALQHLDRVAPRAQRIGAVNTVVVADGGAAGRVLTGHNTDASGFAAALRELAPAAGVERAVVLGGGGAARAIVDALLHDIAVVEVLWVTRSLTELPPWPRVRPLPWTALADVRDVDVLVQATSVGMAGGPLEFPHPVGPELLRPGAAVIDAVYPLPRGGLIERCAAAGHATQDGLAMLLWQGVHALELWLGQAVPAAVVAAMDAALRRSGE
jgi:shikimate dehydrogenase